MNESGANAPPKINGGFNGKSKNIVAKMAATYKDTQIV
jgi:hypothetical protein